MDVSKPPQQKSFGNRMVSGLFWTSLSFGIWKLVSLVTVFILARILSPADFGLVGIAIIVIGVIRMFQDMGVGCALIYSKNTSIELTSTAFYMILASGFIFTLGGYLSAPYMASYFNNPAAESILRALSANIMIVSIGTVPGFLLTKELQFKKRVGPDMVAALAQAAISIYLALKGQGVWSLVAGEIANRSVASIGSWMIHPWRPKLLFDRKLARELFSYSKFMVASSISSFATSNADNIIVARILGATQLGYYSLAFRAASLPSTLTFFVLSKVTFPVFSKLQDNRRELADAFLKTIKYLALISLPAGIIMYMLAPELVDMLLGEKWSRSVESMQALVIYGVFTSIIWQVIEVYKATGRTDLSFGSETIRLIILIPLATACALFGGIHGVAIAQSITVAIASIFYFFPLMRVLEINVTELLDALFPSLLPSGCILLSLWLVGSAFQQHPVLQASVFLKLFVSIFLSACILIAFVAAHSKEFISRIREKSLLDFLVVESEDTQPEPERKAQAESQQESQFKHPEPNFALHSGETKINAGLEASQEAS
jgi:PST family polysaccharide transporter